jgi:deoxyhypusine synthase
VVILGPPCQGFSRRRELVPDVGNSAAPHEIVVISSRYFDSLCGYRVFMMSGQQIRILVDVADDFAVFRDISKSSNFDL